MTAVALTSAPRVGGEYRRDERIEVSVTFSVPVTVTGVPRIGLKVGTETRRAFFVRKAGPAVLLFSYAVAADDADHDGIAVPANGLRLAGGTIVDGYDALAFLDHDAVAADAAHKVDGSELVLTGGVCDRTPQVPPPRASPSVWPRPDAKRPHARGRADRRQCRSSPRPACAPILKMEQIRGVRVGTPILAEEHAKGPRLNDFDSITHAGAAEVTWSAQRWMSGRRASSRSVRR